MNPEREPPYPAVIAVKGSVLSKLSSRSIYLAGSTPEDLERKICVIPCWVVGLGENRTLVVLGTSKPSNGLGTNEEAGRTVYFDNDDITMYASNAGGAQ